MTYDVTVAFSSTNYMSSKVEVKLQNLCQTLSLVPEQIRDKWGKDVLFAGLNKAGF